MPELFLITFPVNVNLHPDLPGNLPFTSCPGETLSSTCLISSSVYFRWSEPLSSSQLTECCRYAAWKKSTACPTIIEIDSWHRRGGARSASASTLPTDTRTTTHTPCTTAHTAGTSVWDEAASSGRSTSRNPHKGTD